MRADLKDLEAFAAVARRKSFRAAAEVVGAPASTLSDAVRRLESRLGVRLLTRTTRSVATTEAGARLLARLAPALAEVDAAIDEARGAAGMVAGALRLNVPTAVARLTLAPILADFLRDNPRVRVEVVAQDDFIDVLGAGFDAGVRYDERLAQDVIAVPIGPRRQRFACAASPDYLRRAGVPARPQDLLGHACIRHRFASGAMPLWEFREEGRLVRLDPPAVLACNATDLALGAARAGLGVVMVFEDAAAPDLASGALAPVLKPLWEPFSGPYLYYAGRRHAPAPLRAFVEFLRARGGQVRPAGESGADG